MGELLGPKIEDGQQTKLPLWKCLHACFSDARNSDGCCLPQPSDLHACGVVSVLFLMVPLERQVSFPKEKKFKGCFLAPLLLP